MDGAYAKIEQVLIAKREELASRLERIKQNVTAGHSADSEEQAQELENAEVVDALDNETRREGPGSRTGLQAASERGWSPGAGV